MFIPLSIGKATVNHVLIRTGPTTSIGNGLLSRFIVHMDWREGNLYLESREGYKAPIAPAGFRLGYSDELSVCVQSVTEGSDAWNKGLRPMLKVVKIDNLPLDNEADFCNYVRRIPGEGPIALEWIDQDGKVQTARILRGVLRSRPPLKTDIP